MVKLTSSWYLALLAVVVASARVSCIIFTFLCRGPTYFSASVWIYFGLTLKPSVFLLTEVLFVKSFSSGERWRQSIACKRILDCWWFLAWKCLHPNATHLQYGLLVLACPQAMDKHSFTSFTLCPVCFFSGLIAIRSLIDVPFFDIDVSNWPQGSWMLSLVTLPSPTSLSTRSMTSTLSDNLLFLPVPIVQAVISGSYSLGKSHYHNMSIPVLTVFPMLVDVPSACTASHWRRHAEGSLQPPPSLYFSRCDTS